MEPLTALFTSNMIGLYFVYGLAFFSLGLAVVVESGRSHQTAFAKVMALLGPFGIVHGLGEWGEMFGRIADQEGQAMPWHDAVAVVLLAASFVILLVFGVRLAAVAGHRQFWLPYLPAFFTLLCLGGVAAVALGGASPEQWTQSAETLVRYTLGLPSSLLASWALLRQRRSFRSQGLPRFGGDLMGAALAFAWYAVLDHIIAEPTSFLPGSVVNDEVFLKLVGIPVQVFRTVAAVGMSYFVIGLLRGFQREIDRTLEEANTARVLAQDEALAAQRRIQEETDALNQELRQATRELSALFETSRILSSTLDLTTILRESIVKIVTLLEPAGLGLVYLHDAASQQLALASRSDLQASHVLALRLGEAIAQQAFETAQPVCCPDQAEALAGLPGFAEEGARTNVLGVPLVVQGRVAGALVLISREGSAIFSPDDMPLVQALGSQLAIAIENAQLYSEVAEKERLRGQLLDRAVSAQEDERKRIARELHDETGQALSGVILGLSGVESALRTNPDLALARLNELKAFAGQALEELRSLVADLRPVLLDDLGLIAALHWFAKRFQERTNLPVQLVIEGSKRRLDPRLETVLFRIAQEAMTNISKHAQARSVNVRLTLEPRIAALTVEDDGKGFDPAQMLDGHYPRPAWGLLGMQERVSLAGGTLRLQSSPGAGTRVTVQIPLGS